MADGLELSGLLITMNNMVSNNTSNLNEDEINILAEAVKDATIFLLDDNMTVDYMELKKQAQRFIRSYDLLARNYMNNSIGVFREQLMKTSQNISGSGIEVLKKIQSFSNAKRIYVNSSYALAFQFDQYLSRFRGEAPREVAYVYNNPQTNTTNTYVLPLNQLQLLVNGRLQILPTLNILENYSTLEKELLSELRKESEQYKEQQKHNIIAQQAYTGTTSRLQRFHETHPDHKGTTGLIMWKEQRQWIISRVNGYGDIKEAYVQALMQKHNSDLDKLCKVNNIGIPIYYSHELISQFFNQYVTTVTALAAIIEEDVVLVDENGNQIRQLAVKGSYGSFPSFNQYYQTAKFIANSPNLNKEDLENWLRRNPRWNNDTQRNKMIGVADVAINSAVESIIQDFLNR